MTPMLASICANLEIRVIPTTKRRAPGETCATQTMERILAEHGPEHLTLVLRSIAETTNHRMELVAPTMWAISDLILAHPAWTQSTAWLDAIDSADLSEMRARAKANRRAVQPRRAIAAYLFEHLSRILAIEPQGRLLL